MGTAIAAPPAPPAPPGASRPAVGDVERAMAVAACASLDRSRYDVGQSSREARVRWAALLPRVIVRAHAGDGGYRRLDDSTVYTGETQSANRGIDVRMAWSLDQLAYRDDELANARFAFEQRATSERLRSQCADTAAKWLRVRLDPIHEEADERAAYAALDIVTSGELGRLDGARLRERSP
jgi:hypothetical protein